MVTSSCDAFYSTCCRRACTRFATPASGIRAVETLSHGPDSSWLLMPRQWLSPTNPPPNPPAWVRNRLLPLLPSPRCASVPTAGAAISCMSASSIPGRCVDHEPQERRPALASARAGHASPTYCPCPTCRGCPAPDVTVGVPVHAPKSSSPASSCQPSRPIVSPPPHLTPNGTRGKSIESPFHRRAPKTLTSFACARLSRPCLSGSSSRLFRDAHHHGLYGAIFVKGVPQGSYPLSRTSVSLFDLKARFFAPTHTPGVAGARRSRQWLPAFSGSPKGFGLDGSEHAGRLAVVGVTMSRGARR